jgi:hypothetical protein
VKHKYDLQKTVDISEAAPKTIANRRFEEWFFTDPEEDMEL